MRQRAGEKKVLDGPAVSTRRLLQFAEKTISTALSFETRLAAAPQDER
jgi:hypothetical protein